MIVKAEHPRHRLPVVKSVAALLAVSCIMLAAAATRVWFSYATASQPNTSSPPMASGAPASADASEGERVEVEVINLGPSGFETSEIMRPAGRVLLAVNNSTGLDEVVLRLARERGQSLQEARVVRGARNWRKPVELAPGNYVLTEINHPDWVCRLTITN